MSGTNSRPDTQRITLNLPVEYVRALDAFQRHYQCKNRADALIRIFGFFNCLKIARAIIKCEEEKAEYEKQRREASNE